AVPGARAVHDGQVPARAGRAADRPLAERDGEARQPGGRRLPGVQRAGAAGAEPARRARRLRAGGRTGAAGAGQPVAVARGGHHHAPLLGGQPGRAQRDQRGLRVDGAGGDRDREAAAGLRLGRGPAGPQHPAADDDRGRGPRRRRAGQRGQAAVQPGPVDGPADRQRARAAAGRRGRAAGGAAGAGGRAGDHGQPVLGQLRAGRRGERPGHADRRGGARGTDDPYRGAAGPVAGRPHRRRLRVVRAADGGQLPRRGQRAGRAGAAGRAGGPGRPARAGGRAGGRDGRCRGDRPPGAGRAARREPAGAQPAGPVRRPGRHRPGRAQGRRAARRHAVHPRRRRRLPGRLGQRPRLPPARPAEDGRPAGRVPARRAAHDRL
ncbi:MAG: Butyryl-CoA dehydrogenase, partial [uncultured Corynebacteriales bacterium]